MLINPLPFGTATSSANRATDEPPPSADSRNCTRCLRQQPMNAFRVIQAATGRRANHCNECHASAERERRSSAKHNATNARLFRSWGMLAKAKDRRRSIENLVLRLLAHFGDDRNLAVAWVRAFNEASACRRLRSLAALIELLRWLEATEQPERLDLLSDAELQRQLADAQQL